MFIIARSYHILVWLFLSYDLVVWKLQRQRCTINEWRNECFRKIITFTPFNTIKYYSSYSNDSGIFQYAEVENRKFRVLAFQLFNHYCYETLWEIKQLNFHLSYLNKLLSYSRKPSSNDNGQRGRSTCVSRAFVNYVSSTCGISKLRG